MGKAMITGVSISGAGSAGNLSLDESNGIGFVTDFDRELEKTSDKVEKYFHSTLSSARSSAFSSNSEFSSSPYSNPKDVYRNDPDTRLFQPSPMYNTSVFSRRQEERNHILPLSPGSFQNQQTFRKELKSDSKCDFELGRKILSSPLHSNFCIQTEEEGTPDQKISSLEQESQECQRNYPQFSKRKIPTHPEPREKRFNKSSPKFSLKKMKNKKKRTVRTPPPNKIDKDCCSVNYVAEILDVTALVVSRLCANHLLKGKKVGRAWSIDPSDLKVFQEKHKKENPDYNKYCYSVLEAAELLDITGRQLRRAIKDGKLEVISQQCIILPENLKKFSDFLKKNPGYVKDGYSVNDVAKILYVPAFVVRGLCANHLLKGKKVDKALSIDPSDLKVFQEKHKKENPDYNKYYYPVPEAAELLDITGPQLSRAIKDGKLEVINITNHHRIILPENLKKFSDFLKENPGYVKDGYSVNYVAELLDVPVFAVRMLCANHLLKGKKVGKAWSIDPTDLKVFQEKHKKENPDYNKYCYSVPEAAELLDITRPQLRRAIKDGKLGVISQRRIILPENLKKFSDSARKLSLEKMKNKKKRKVPTLTPNKVDFDKDKVWYTTKELAARFNIQKATIMTALEQGRLKGKKNGHGWLVHLDEFEKYRNRPRKKRKVLTPTPNKVGFDKDKVLYTTPAMALD